VESSAFFAAAVGAGFVLIGLVVYSYVRPQPEHRPSVTALLGLLGFVLIASPNWTSISIRSENLELSLLREMQARQLQALAELQGGARAEPAAAPPPRLDPPEPANATPPPDVRPPTPDPGSGREPLRAGTPPPSPSPTHSERLFEAFARGDLDLRQLSDTELLDLNDRITALRNTGTTR
jgi:hypothetical protein